MGNRSKPAVDIPLVLPMQGCWELEEGSVDSVLFFRTITHAFPEASTAYFEGTSIEADVVALFQRFLDPGKYLPKPQTIWPASSQFRCTFNTALCSELVSLANRHAEPELFDHFFLYSGDKPILEWPDAFNNCIWISYTISEQRVAQFAQALGLSYRHERIA
jgi:hypothetical protein